MSFWVEKGKKTQAKRKSLLFSCECQKKAVPLQLQRYKKSATLARKICDFFKKNLRFYQNRRFCVALWRGVFCVFFHLGNKIFQKIHFRHAPKGYPLRKVEGGGEVQKFYKGSDALFLCLHGPHLCKHSANHLCPKTDRAESIIVKFFQKIHFVTKIGISRKCGCKALIMSTKKSLFFNEKGHF